MFDLNENGKTVRDAILDAVDNGVPLRRAIAIALQNMNFGRMEAGSIQSALQKEADTRRG